MTTNNKETVRTTLENRNENYDRIFLILQLQKEVEGIRLKDEGCHECDNYEIAIDRVQALLDKYKQ